MALGLFPHLIPNRNSGDYASNSAVNVDGRADSWEDVSFHVLRRLHPSLRVDPICGTAVKVRGLGPGPLTSQTRLQEIVSMALETAGVPHQQLRGRRTTGESH